MSTKHVLLFVIVCVGWLNSATAYDISDLPGVPGIIGITPADSGSCVGVYVPMEEGHALSGIFWYNNDGLVTYPEVLVASGGDGSPEPVSAAFTVATDVQGGSSAWSELTFSEPIAAINDGFYVVFRLPEGSEHVGYGEGGGAGIGYTEGANGFTGWLSLDGENWLKLHDDFGMALVPLTVAAEEGMVQKSLNDDETPITRTAILLPSPNPFNPLTKLRFQLKTGSEVELSIYNVKGERVAQLIDESYPRGHHEVIWAGQDDRGRRVSSGAYFARFKADNVVQTQRLLLVK